jgi:hypothetical protein
MTHPNAAEERIIASTSEPNGFDTAAKVVKDAGYEDLAIV